jgi:hypothetical protein
MENTKENNILVIGNGFDLYHELKTKYIDFVKFTKKDLELSRTPFIKCFQMMADANDGWIDCEDTIHGIIKLFDKILNEICDTKKTYFSTKKLSKESMEIIKVFEHYFIKRDTMYSSMQITAEFINGFNEFDKRKFLDSLKRDLDDTIRALWHYLKFDLEQAEEIKLSEQIKNIQPSYVINFNYTNTVSELYKVEEENIFYIHGNLKDESKNMVFGIPDDKEENLDFVYFKKYFQRIQKKTGVVERSRFHANESERIPVNLHFFGHSLGLTDSDVIREITEMSDKMTIYYLDQSDYESKVINLLHIFGKKDGVEKIQNGLIEFEPIQ